MLEALGIRKAYRSGEDILSDVSLTLAENETLAVVGPSGCGKTTLLYLLCGLARPDSGRVLLDGTPVVGPNPDMSIILQDYGLLPWKSVIENVALGLKLRGMPQFERLKLAREQLAELGISGRDRDWPGRLSGGEKQRVAIARAFVGRPRLLLMDEPFSSLDALTREKLQHTLLDVWSRRRVPYVLVTHSLEEAVFLGRRILVLAGRPAGVAASFDNPGFGDGRYRERDDYFELVRRLRRSVEDLW